jgi:peptidoglycan/LPS O-acetylase OafA/YrhL
MKQAIRFTEIDLLRFLAAVAVMILHYGIRGFADGDHISPLHFPTLGPMVRYNYLGVNLFFMISGFVILMTVQGKNLQDFVVSRLVRLYPAYWVCCTLTFVVILLFARDQIYTSLPRYLLNLTMLNGFFNIGGIDGPYWTLCTELKFYLLVGILVSIRQIQNVQYYLGLWLGISAIHLAWPTPVVGYFLVPEYSAYFIAGSLFYLIHKEGFSRYRVFLLAASFVVSIAYDAITLMEKSYWYHMAFGVPVLIGIIASFYLVFLLISLKKSASRRWDRLFVFLGTISYPLYLLHHNIGMAIFQNLHTYVNRYLLLIGTAVAMLFLARLIHVQVERRYAPVLRTALKGLFSQRHDGRESVAP